MSSDDYHRGPGASALSKGGLVELSRSPAHYKAMLDNPQEPTPSLIFGTQFHCAVLEPELFAIHYIVEPKVDKRTKAGKEEYAAFQALLQEKGQEVISQESLDLIGNMKEALFQSQVASGLLSDGLSEQSIFWHHPKWQFMCKCRPDHINTRHRVLVDIKTTLDASPEAFSRAVVNYRYHWQAAHYLEGVNTILEDEYSEFIYIAIEKSPPFAVQIYRIKHDDIYLAQEQIKPLLSRYAECLASDTWPGPPDRIQSLELPQWYINKALD